MAVSKIQTGLRLEEDTWKKISYIAKINKRSLNAQIELIIEECIGQFERNNGFIPLDEIQSD